MDRTITVKGVGSVRVKPDWAVVPITSVTEDAAHEKVIALAETALEQIRASLAGAGFARDDVKTLEFGIHPKFESVHDGNGNYRSVFSGYACRHGLKLEFSPEPERLAAVIDALASCPARPEFSVQFTVKDQQAVKEQMLAEAAADARRKANILCAASGVALGALVRIDYSWRDVNLYSESRLMLSDGAPAPRMAKMNLAPDDVSASDSASFVWEIG